MAKLEKITSTSWKQPFKDREKEFHLWGTHKEIADHCNLQDGTKRLLNIQFESNHEIDVTDHFQITSGREISFPKDFQELIKPVIKSNPQSYFIVRVLDVAVDVDAENEISTTGSATIKTRVGQAKFRNKLLDYWHGRCAVSGVEFKEILKASHIKPWSDSSDNERLDKFNGLLLTPNLDSLFDKGLITFKSDGVIELSQRILPFAAALGVNHQMRISLEPDHEKYLKYHRKNIFES
ncbi:MAG: HNH endonuclease [Gammaproteobacteria bacterium]|nr:HNH endonuclease [Gammaproteobacteria bacterium]